jgi:hypothetical protein
MVLLFDQCGKRGSGVRRGGIRNLRRGRRRKCLGFGGGNLESYKGIVLF